MSRSAAELLGARRIVVPANGLDFEVFEAGAGDRLALLLHGFPQHAIVWRFLVPALVAKGCRVWAVNQRGYGETSRPARREDYSLANLTADVAGLIDASGASRVALVGHDWGGFVAWVFAIRRIRPLDRLVVFNIPHPLSFRRALTEWPQRLRSLYGAFFQIPLLPDFLLGAAGGAVVEGMLRHGRRPPAAVERDAIAIYRANAAAPGAATAMLNWYRAAGRDIDAATDLDAVIETPTLVVWGEDDIALGLSCLTGTERYVSDLRIELLPGVSHFSPEDAPAKAGLLLDAFL